jgi:tight adherence protein C
MTALFLSIAAGLLGFAAVSKVTPRGLPGRRGARLSQGQRAYDPDYFAGLIESLALCTAAGMDALRSLETMLAAAPPHPLGDEVRAALREVRAGATGEEAWRRLAERVPAEDVRLAVALLVQSGRLGAGLTVPLRGLAEGIRERAYRAAEKRSLEAPVKLLLPMLGVFASILVVIVGALVLDISAPGAP